MSKASSHSESLSSSSISAATFRGASAYSQGQLCRLAIYVLQQRPRVRSSVVARGSSRVSEWRQRSREAAQQLKVPSACKLGVQVVHYRLQNLQACSRSQLWKICAPGTRSDCCAGGAGAGGATARHRPSAVRPCASDRWRCRGKRIGLLNSAYDDRFPECVLQLIATGRCALAL